MELVTYTSGRRAASKAAAQVRQRLCSGSGKRSGHRGAGMMDVRISACVALQAVVQKQKDAAAEAVRGG